MPLSSLHPEFARMAVVPLHSDGSPAQTPPEPDFARCYEAVRSRDPAFDGRFYTAVRSTRIFCRPVCPARTPKPENCLFFGSAAEAIAAGFRACRRCRPESAPGSAAWRGARAVVDRALRQMEPGEAAGPAEVEAARLGIGARHRRRLFRTHLGRSPRDVVLDARLARAQTLLTQSADTLTGIAITSGFGDLRQFQRAVRRRFGCTPREWRTRLSVPHHDIEASGDPTMPAILEKLSPARASTGAARPQDRSPSNNRRRPDTAPFSRVGTAALPSPLGPLLVAFATDAPAGDLFLVSLDFAPYEDRFVHLLGKRFTGAEFRPEPAPRSIATAFEAWFAGVPDALANIPQFSAGTVFQERTWRALREIPLGETRAYRDIAAAIGAPKAVRAVARANALNPIAIATPCHRVIGADGTLTGYAGGLSRKAMLLDHERAMAKGLRSAFPDILA